MLTVSEICDKIQGFISKIRVPLPSIPSALIACAAINRPGLSAMMMASEIIRRSPEAGAYFGDLPSGAKNVMEAMERIRCEVIVNAIKNDMQISAAIKPGGIIIQNADGSVGTNSNFVDAKGIGR